MSSLSQTSTGYPPLTPAGARSVVQVDISAKAPLGRPSDSLMVQITVDNVMKVHQLFDEQVGAMQRALQEGIELRSIPSCGDDPVSRDAVTVFQPKIDEIVATHAAHLEELREARDRLEQAAQQYGLMDVENANSLRAVGN